MVPLIFQRILPYYRLPVFRRLYNQFGAIVCHSEERKGASLTSAWREADFPQCLIPRMYLVGKETAALQHVLAPLRRYRPTIVISEFAVAYASLWLLMLLRPVFRFKLLLWTHGISNDEIFQPLASGRGKLARWLLSRADGIICYSRERRNMLAAALGAQAPKLYVASNTIDTSAQFQLYDRFEAVGRESIRRELGCGSGLMLVYIGRLIQDKGIKLLLRAFDRISNELSITLHIIGDGPERTNVEEQARRNPLIRFHGAIWDEEVTGKILYAADLCLNPGYVGLSIVQCFSFGTPLLTCRSSEEGPFHSPEIEYLQPGVNGLYAEARPEAIAEAAISLLNDPERLQAMSAAARQTAETECSLDRMMEGFDTALREATGRD